MASNWLLKSSHERFVWAKAVAIRPLLLTSLTSLKIYNWYDNSGGDKWWAQLVSNSKTVFSHVDWSFYPSRTKHALWCTDFLLARFLSKESTIRNSSTENWPFFVAEKVSSGLSLFFFFFVRMKSESGIAMVFLHECFSKQIKRKNYKRDCCVFWISTCVWRKIIIYSWFNKSMGLQLRTCNLCTENDVKCPVLDA